MNRAILIAAACWSLAVGTSLGTFHPGLRNIATKAYSPTMMDPTVFANLWRSWDTPSRDAAGKASAAVRRAMTLERYGLLESPYENAGAPLGFVVQKDGSYAMTCLVCHAGAVAGQTIIGLPNNALEFSGIFEDVEKTVRILHDTKPGHPPFPQGLLFLSGGKETARVDFPEGMLSVSRGTVNSFTFSVQFLAHRDKDLNLIDTPLDLKPLNHYLDVPPLWHVSRKTALYTDGFTPKSVRALMQFSLDPSFSAAQFKSWEDDYKDIYRWLHTIESPKYNGAIDRGRAAAGQRVYEQSCARCHGSPGRAGKYPNKIVSIDTVDTDRGRLDGLSPEFKTHFVNSWMGRYGETRLTQSHGYVAPPLDGIWATAPYLHNGSVPTLYHLLFPQERPAVWRVRDYRSYDKARVGLSIELQPAMPATSTLFEKRSYYDTTRPTMSNRGHRFGAELSREHKLNLIEYLKSI